MECTINSAENKQLQVHNKRSRVVHWSRFLPLLQGVYFRKILFWHRGRVKHIAYVKRPIRPLARLDCGEGRVGCGTPASGPSGHYPP